MVEFFQFPSTPHLIWLGSESQLRNDKVLSDTASKKLLFKEVVIEEKIDGANIGIFLDPSGTIQVQNRGHLLTAPYPQQFKNLDSWVDLHADELRESIPKNCILFGEWCAAKHSLPYDALPDWLLLFDVYDRECREFWSSTRRNSIANAMRLSTAPTIFRGHININQIERLVSNQKSKFRNGRIEGVIIRSENSEWLEGRAKVVAPDFIQAIDTHWRRKRIEWNRLDPKSWHEE